MWIERVEKAIRTVSTHHPAIAALLRSARPMVQPLVARFRTQPKNYRSVVPDYSTYVSMQTQKYQSFESQNSLWERGQQRYVERVFTDLDRNAKILDIASGDGVGLRLFRRLNFTNVTGVEFSKEKAAQARLTGYRVEESDMHNLKAFVDGEFDVVYSSHTLEHAYEPQRVVEEVKRVLQPNGTMYVVLPYPDPPENRNDEVHGGKYELGSHLADNGEAVQRFFRERGFDVLSVEFDSFREPEIWLTLKKRG